MMYRGIKLFLYACLFLAFPNILQSQFYETGQEPASIQWKQINTANFQIIFPSDFEKEANRLANTLEYLYDHVAKSLKHKPKKISIILHSHSSNSNGLVTWAPKRMELYTTPPQNAYAQDWMDQLAVHELRHVVQIDEMDKGLFEIFSLIFGQQFVGALTGFIPGWLFEGDAVNNETALTSTGRGRDASFEMGMKALVTSMDSLYPYDKAVLGSYKHYIPDRYELGYPMVAWPRKNFKPSEKDSTLDFFGKYPTPVFSMPCGLPKLTCYCTKCLYKSAYSDLRRFWQNQLSNIPAQTAEQWAIRSTSLYTSYRLPQIVNDTTILAVKSGIDQLTSIVLVYKSGKEKELYVTGGYNTDQLSYANGKFIISEEIPDLRWANRSFYNIQIGDIATGKIRALTNKTRLFAPCFSPDGNRIAAVDISVKNEYSLVILNASTREQQEYIPIPENQFPQLPVWTKDGKSILTIFTGKKGKSLQMISLQNQTWQELISPSVRDITMPSDAGEFVLFVGEYNGTNNIYAYKKKDQSVWQVSNVKYGAFSPKLSTDNKLIFSEYTSHGYRVESSIFNPAAFQSLSQVTDGSAKLFQASARLERFNFQDSILPTKNYPIENYSKWKHLVNIHSWAPFYFDYNNLNIENNSITPGFSVLSQDALGNLLSNVGYSFANNSSSWKANITYKGWYPVINFSMAYGGVIPIIRPLGVTSIPVDHYSRQKLTTTIYVPLNLSSGRFFSGLMPGVELDYQDEWFYQPQNKNFKNGVTYTSIFLTAYSYYKTSLRDINPKWGMILTGKLIGSPDNNQINNIFYLLGRYYLPGFIDHHSLSITTGYQEQTPQLYALNSQILFPRGFASELTYKLSTLSVDYTFPIFYPDFVISPFLFIKRIQGNLFFDIANNKYKYNPGLQSNNTMRWQSKNLASTGMDLTSDFHLLRIAFPINSGIRMIYIPKTGTYSYELLFRIDLNNF